MDIKELITENENIIWEGKPNKTLYIWSTVLPQLPFALIWFVMDYFIITSFLGAENASEMLFILIPFFAIHLMPVWIVLWALFKNSVQYKNVLYAITDKRVIIKDGLVGIDFESIDYAEIDKISVNVSIFEKLSNVGTIKLKVDSYTYNLQAIENPYEIFKRVQKISFDVKTDINYPNAKRPENNPGYNTKYDAK